MNDTIDDRIDKLDDKQAIYQIKLLLQSAMDSNPQLGAVDNGAIAAKLEAIDSTFGDATDILKKNLKSPLPTKEAGGTARDMLHLFAATTDGKEILAASLEKKDNSADFGLITFPLVCTFLWLAVTGDFDLNLGGFRYRKKGLTPDQQAKLVKPLMPSALKSLIKAAFHSGEV